MRRNFREARGREKKKKKERKYWKASLHHRACSPQGSQPYTPFLILTSQSGCCTCPSVYLASGTQWVPGQGGRLQRQCPATVHSVSWHPSLTLPLNSWATLGKLVSLSVASFLLCEMETAAVATPTESREHEKLRGNCQSFPYPSKRGCLVRCFSHITYTH